MKLNKFFMIFCVAFASVAFISCNDANRQNNVDDDLDLETDTMDMMEEDDMEMDDNTIGAIAMDTPELSTLVSALQSAELAEMMMEDDGPFTVFAPTNTAFDAVPSEALDNLMMPENQAQLQGVLQYHVVSGEITAAELIEWINENDGSYTIETLAGAELTAMLEGENVVLTDASGNMATIVQTDIMASNGVVHVIDAVIMQ